MRLRRAITLAVAAALVSGACQAQLTTPTPTPPTGSLGCGDVTPPPVSSPGCSLTPVPPPTEPTATDIPPTDIPPTQPPPSTPATATPSPSPTPPGGLIVERTIPYATTGDCGVRVSECQQFVDVFAPSAPAAGEAYPVAVMIHGRPRKPRDMEPLAELIAARGAVVFNADYRGVRPVVQRGWPAAPEDIACAIRFARAHAADYGGDPSTLVLVGHSYGGYLGPLIALAGELVPGDCLVGPDVSALPTGFVGIAGNYVVEGEPVWDVWYGGNERQAPQAWRSGNYRTHLGGNPGLVVRLIHETGDPIIPPRQPRRFHRDLRAAGYDTRLQLIDGNEHFALLDPAGNGRLVVPLILELLGLE
jgi:acetyl esterase/lipase